MISDLLRPLLARRLAPTERRALALELRQLAARQEALAEADERLGHVVRRLDVQRLGGALHLRPCGDGQGWAVTLPTGERSGMPRLSIGQDPADTLGLVEGRMPATISSGAIVAA